MKLTSEAEGRCSELVFTSEPDIALCVLHFRRLQYQFFPIEEYEIKFLIEYIFQIYRLS